MKGPRTPAEGVVIGMLLMLAIVLSVLMFVGQPKQAEANMLSHQGATVMVTAGTVGNDELLHVLDTQNGKLVTYGWNASRSKLVAVAADRLFQR